MNHSKFKNELFDLDLKKELGLNLDQENKLTKLMQENNIKNSGDYLKDINKYEDRKISKNQNLNDKNLIAEQQLIIYNLKNELGKTREPLLFKRQNKSKRDPITLEIYQLILNEIPERNYVAIRLRLAFCLLLITKLRISDLLLLKMDQLDRLLNLGWIIIKTESSTQNYEYKIFLTTNEQKILNDQRKDIELFLQWKEPDAFIFTSDLNHYRPLRRESFTRSVNKILNQVSKKLPDKPKLTSHSFRITDTSEF